MLLTGSFVEKGHKSVMTPLFCSTVANVGEPSLRTLNVIGSLSLECYRNMDGHGFKHFREIFIGCPLSKQLHTECFFFQTASFQAEGVCHGDRPEAPEEEEEEEGEDEEEEAPWPAKLGG